jgi:hypothetical protein
MAVPSITTQIVESIRSEPSRWKRNIIWLERDDGLSIVLKRPFTGQWWLPKVQLKCDGLSMCFPVSFIEGVRLKRAWNAWRDWAIGEDWK